MEELHLKHLKINFKYQQEVKNNNFDIMTTEVSMLTS